MRKTFEDLTGRILSIAAFIFPFIEVASYFGPKVFLSTESFALKTFYANYIEKISRFYT